MYSKSLDSMPLILAILLYQCIIISIYGALRDLVAFEEIRKREKHPWASVNLIKLQALACNFTKINTPPWVFFTFLKLYKCSQIA